MPTYDSLMMGRTCRRDSFPHKVADVLAAQAEAARAAMPSWNDSGRHVAALLSLADHVRALGPRDQKLRTLEIFQEGEGWTPGTQTSVFLANLASTQHPDVSPSDAFDEMLSLAAEDYRDELQQARRRASEADAGSDELRERIAELEVRAGELEADNNLFRDEVEKRGRDLAQAGESIEWFRARLAGQSEQEAKRSSRDARVPVEGEQNIKKRGDSFVVEWMKDGKQNRQSFQDDLAAAVRYRDELIEKGEIKRREVVAA